MKIQGLMERETSQVIAKNDNLKDANVLRERFLLSAKK